ncbi:MAG: rod shape-determining protein RodA [bacterium]
MQNFSKQDWVINGIVFLLLCFGLSAIYSASPDNFYRQAIFCLIGFVLMFLVSRINYHNLKNYTLLLYCLAIILLLLVLVFGHKIRGASSWFNLGKFGFQPVELAKLIMIIVLAKYFSQNSHNIYKWRTIITSALYLILPVGLIFLQPDMGSAFVFIVIWLGINLAAGIRLKHLCIIFLILIITASASWYFLLKDYQKNRFIVFLNPALDPLGRGYNIIQSIIAVGSGSFFGNGLGYGSQSRLDFLPEQHTDFIFAAIAEELGFIGAFFIIILFGLLFSRCFRILFKTEDNFGQFLVLGIIIYLFTHVFINIGMNIGLMPITGIPLPMISYGGSNLLITLIAIGLLQSIRNGQTA